MVLVPWSVKILIQVVCKGFTPTHIMITTRALDEYRKLGAMRTAIFNAWPEARMNNGPALNRQEMPAPLSPSEYRCPNFALLSRSAAKL